MKRKIVFADPEAFPDGLKQFICTHRIYDSSCSQEARVWYLEGREPLFLKSAPAGTLKTEVGMTRFLHEKGLATDVLAYISADRDWLLTAALPGEDCTHAMYLEDPRRLCDTTATLLRQLHEQDVSGCPVISRNEASLATASRNYAAGKFDADLFPAGWGYASAGENT